MIVLYLVLGLAAGVLSGLFGIGGGIVIVPALVLLARFSQLTATGTSLGALLMPVGILGALQYYRSGNLDVRASALIAVGLTAGVYLGAIIAPEIAPGTLRRLFAVFLAIVAIRMWVMAK